MKSEKEMIIDRLIILLDLIEDICALSLPVPDYFLTLKNQIIEFKSSVENDTFENPENSKTNITHFKRQFINLFIYHCNTTAEKYNLNWNILPQGCELEKLPNISTLREALSKFKQALAEKNHENTVALNLIKNIAQSQKKHNLVLQIENLLVGLIENPHRVLDSDTLSTLQQKTQGRYKKPKKKSCRIVEIEDMPEFNEGPLYEKIKAWELCFWNQVNLFNECTIDPHIKNSSLTEDVILAKYLPLFEQKTNLLSDLIKKTEESLKDIKKISCHQKILDELTIALEQLTVINEERERVANTISERFRLISPKADDAETLMLYKKAAILLLKKNLAYFIKQFSLTDLANKSDPDSLIFIEKLHAFANTLVISLKHNAFVIDKSRLEQLHEKLLEHLGKKTNFFGMPQKQKTLNIEDASTLLKTLFIKDSGYATQEHIAYIYNLSAILDNFPIKKIKNFHFLEEAQKNLNVELFNGVENLKTEANPYITTLSSLIDLNSDLTSEDTLNNAKQHVTKLTEQLAKLEKIEELYQAECKSYKEIHNPIEKLSKITSLSLIQEMLKTEIVSFKKDKPSYNSSISALIQEYNDFLNLTHSSLTESLEQTKAALEATDSSPQEITGIIKAPNNLLTKMIDEKSNAQRNLRVIKLEVDEAKTHLNTKTTECKYKLLDAKNATLLKLRKNLNDLPLISLANLNPLKLEVDKVDKNARSKLLAIPNYFNTLFTLPGKKLQLWLTEINTAIDAAENCLSLRKETIEKAKILEERINSAPFQTSLRIISTLEDEIKRIIKRHMQKALDKTEREDEELILKTIHDNPLGYLEYCNNHANAQVLLLRIDPRLFKLISMHYQFQMLNNRYINKNTELLNNVGYIQALLKSVMVHLHHDNMENLSDGKQWKFIQWIRVNILKPIHQINPFKEQSNRFFPTPLACKTERELIELGNDVYLSLQNAASAAA